MKLTALKAEFVLRSMGDKTPIGVELDCPCGCPHRLYVPFADPDAASNWVKTGDTIETLTLSPSVQRGPRTSCPKKWHGFIKKGEAEDA